MGFRRQVGLTIGEPMASQQLAEDHGGSANRTIDEGLSDDSNSAPEAKKPRTSNSRAKKFRAAWLMFDIFKDWLRPHANPELATCIVCSRVIKAGKSELEKHATGKRHLKMLKEQQNQGTLLMNSGGDVSGNEFDSYSLDGSYQHLKTT